MSYETRNLIPSPAVKSSGTFTIPVLQKRKLRPNKAVSGRVWIQSHVSNFMLLPKWHFIQASRVMLAVTKILAQSHIRRSDRTGLARGLAPPVIPLKEITGSVGSQCGDRPVSPCSRPLAALHAHLAALSGRPAFPSSLLRTSFTPGSTCHPEGDSLAGPKTPCHRARRLPSGRKASSPKLQRTVARMLQ